jgi:hypothetical protein
MLESLTEINDAHVLPTRVRGIEVTYKFTKELSCDPRNPSYQGPQRYSIEISGVHPNHYSYEGSLSQNLKQNSRHWRHQGVPSEILNQESRHWRRRGVSSFMSIRKRHQGIIRNSMERVTVVWLATTLNLVCLKSGYINVR